MNIPLRVSDYLQSSGVDYQLLEHHHSNSSLGTAVAAEIPFHQIAKAVILLDHEDRKLMAILPADRKISLSVLSEQLNHTYRLAKEPTVYKMFGDCDHGAIPPVAGAYNVDVIYDDSLLDNNHVFIESGDHETLIKLDKENLVTLMSNAKHQRFSHQFIH